MRGKSRKNRQTRLFSLSESKQKTTKDHQILFCRIKTTVQAKKVVRLDWLARKNFVKKKKSQRMGGKSRKNRQKHLRSPLTNLSLNRTGNSRIFAISFLSWQSKSVAQWKLQLCEVQTPPVFTRRCYATTSVTKGKLWRHLFSKTKARSENSVLDWG